MLKTIITSEARMKILRYFYSHPQGYSPFVREISRDTKLEINAVRREIIRMSEGKLLNEDPRGNRLHYCLNKDSSLYYDLASIISKEIGLGKLLRSKKKSLGNLNFCTLSLEFFLQSPTRKKESLDVLFLGSPYMSNLRDLFNEYQKKTNLEINYMVVSSEEYRILKERKDNLLMSFLIKPRSTIFGSQETYIN
ncbi:hypothetical protein GW755_01790 [bacterium]|nr:hypothetical protein [bacterium]